MVRTTKVMTVVVVCLAMAAPAFGSVDIDSTWTVDAAWGLGYTSDARFGSGSGKSGTVNIVSGGTWNTDGEMRFAENGVAATINVEVGGTLNAEVEMVWNEGEVGTQTNRLNVYGTAYVEQLKMYGFAGDDITTVGNGTDAATLTIVEGLLAKEGVASIIINAGSTMIVDGDWAGAFNTNYANGGSIDLVGTGTLQTLNSAGVNDISKIIGNGGTTAVTSAVVGDYTVYSTIPEPATMSLLALGGLAMLRRRRKR